MIKVLKALWRKRERRRGPAGETYPVTLDIPVGLRVVAVTVREVGK